MNLLGHTSAPAGRPWVPFVVAALLATLSVGALQGALDLWTLQVRLTPVTPGHPRAHGLAQVFGFLLLFTMGLSLHLVPRLVGGAPPVAGWARRQQWLAIGGLALLVAGRLGALLPGSWWLGPVGALLLWAAVSRWLGFIFAATQAGPGGDRLGLFLLAGTGWWWLAAALVATWSLGQWVTGPLAALSLEPAWAAALVGGAGSWIFGLMLRAGACTLRLERPGPARQRVMFLGWQLAAACAVAAAWLDSRALAALGAVAMLVTLGALRPWRDAAASLPGEPFHRRVLQAALAFLALSAAVSLWRASGLWPAALAVDAARHAYTLGFATLTVFGLAARMVPGFGGAPLAFPRLYAAGALFTAASAAGRLLELWPSRAVLAVSGSSGVLAALGVGAMTGCLLWTLAPAVAPRAVPSPALR